MTSGHISKLSRNHLQLYSIKSSTFKPSIILLGISEFHLVDTPYLLIYLNSAYRKEWEEAREAVNTFATRVPSISSKTNSLMMNQTRLRLDAAWTKYKKTLEYVGIIKVDLNIQERWTALTLEFQEFHQQNVRTNYSSALDELEHLVVMCLFELAKMSSSWIGTCLCLRHLYLRINNL